MISRLRGVVEAVLENRLELRVQDLVYELMIPAYLENELRKRKGEELELFTQYYLEGGQAGSHLTPRLVGFASRAEREFYLQLTKVPGLGAKMVLKALVASPPELARAIEREDKSALANLPGVGRRTADKIVAALKGKVAEFAALAGPEPEPVTLGEVEEEALQVLLQISYKRSEAESLIRRALKKHPDLDSADKIVQAVFKETGSGAAR